jgi:Repair protein Rad1/Rec1/Rad17
MLLQFATMVITSGGLTVFVEESSLVAGMWPTHALFMRSFTEAHVQIAAAYVPAQIFDEFAYSPPIKSLSASPTPPEASQAEEATVLEFPLRVFIDSLSIFSTGTAPNVSEGRGQNRRWVREREHGGDDDVPRGRIEAYFGAGAGKTVGMRLSYAGGGHPLSLLMCVFFHYIRLNTVLMTAQR